jgi:hypothetical protein
VLSEVHAARERSHGYLLETVTIILGTYRDSDDAEHAQARRALGSVDKGAEIIRAVARPPHQHALAEIPDDLDEMDFGDDSGDTIE